MLDMNQSTLGALPTSFSCGQLLVWPVSLLGRSDTATHEVQKKSTTN